MAKNKAAAALAALRWQGIDADDRSAEMTERNRQRHEALTPERRSEIAQKAAKASAKVRSKAAKERKSAERKTNGGKAVRAKRKKS